MTSPVVYSDIEVFDTSHMNGVSTMGRNIRLDNGHMTPRDENMNYKSSDRILRVDESRHGRVPVGRRGMRISTINIDDSFDMQSTVSDPTTARKQRVQRIMERRSVSGRSPATSLRNVNQPDVSLQQHKYYSLNRDVPPPAPQVQIEKTEEVELDPHLDQAHKTGQNYNVSLKLNANVVNSSEMRTVVTPAAARTGMLQEEYVEENLYTRDVSSHDHNSLRVNTGQGHVLSPRDTRSSVSSGSTLHSPAVNRSKTNITLLDDDNGATPLHAQPASTVEHLRIRQYHDESPRVQQQHRSSHSQRASRESRGYVVKSNISSTPPPQRLSSNGHTMRYQSPANSSTNGAEPKFSMSIDQTMTMDYVPSDEQPQLQPQQQPQQRSAPAMQKPKKHRRAHNKLDYRMTNGDVGRSRDLEDLEQYLSPAEDHDYDSGDEYPQVVRGSILIKNAIDTTSAPKVIDVVDDDSDSDYDVTDNVNPFDNRYLQSRENPMYSSDPDLARLQKQRVHHQQQHKPQSHKHKPHVAQVFIDTQKENATNQAFAQLEKQRYDTEIKVTRGQYAIALVRSAGRCVLWGGGRGASEQRVER